MRKGYRWIWMAAAWLCLVTALRAEEPPARFVAAVRRALDADAAWTMTKTTVSPVLTLESSGRVSCFAGRGIVWRMAEPFVQTITMTTNSLSIISSFERVTKQLKEMPYYSSIREQTDRLLAGETASFSDAFSWTWTENGTRWTITLKPKRRQFARWVAKVTLSGEGTLDRAQIDYASGERADIRFKETAFQQHGDW